MNFTKYIEDIYKNISLLQSFEYPWEITNKAEEIILKLIKEIKSNEFIKQGEVFIHKKAIVENNVTIKGPVIINEGCFVAANTYLRNGVYLDKNVKIGPSCEIKASFIFNDSTIAHLNYVGNSIIGSRVNFEAGVILANHYNDRENKIIIVKVDGKTINTRAEKFGALIGDDSKIGANSVINPGIILKPKSIVGRLKLVK
jgi:NDP-sugar pyrophosphorylase family protein